MAQGEVTGTGASVEALSADYQREYVTFQMTDASQTIHFGFNNAAVVDEGLALRRVGDSFTVGRELARGSIKIIASGAGGQASFQTGSVLSVVTGPTILPAV